jgi:osmotically-inducible protein OsmY
MRALLLLLALPFTLSACVAALVGAGTETGIALAEERSVGNKVDDSVLYTDIGKRLIQAKNNLYYSVTVRVRHQRVMLTGIVPTEALAQRAVSAAWQAKGTKEVINEIIVGDAKFIDTANDYALKKNLEARLLATKDVWVINYSIDVVNGTAYLLGRTYDRAELNRVMNVAKTTKGVKRVVSHLQVRSEMSVDISAPATGAPLDTVPAYRPSSSAGAPPVQTTDAPTDGTITTESVGATDIPPPATPAGGGY